MKRLKYFLSLFSFIFLFVLMRYYPVFAADCDIPGFCMETNIFGSCKISYECAELGGGRNDCGECEDSSLKCCRPVQNEFNDCYPIPNECDASDCFEDQICQWQSGIAPKWTCVQDTEGTCSGGVSNCDAPSYCHEVTAFNKGCPVGSIPDEAHTCGDENFLCCREDDNPCEEPGQCIERAALGGCPAGYNLYPGSCTGNLECCLKDGADPDPRYSPFIYRGPIIEDLASLLAPIVKILYFAGIIIGVAVIIYSGYIFMLSQGNPQQTEEGSNWLTSAVIGILFILLSVAIFRVIITSLLGLEADF